MPNGESRNWIRLQITLESFYLLYNKWPSVVRTYPFFIRELQEKLSETDWQRPTSKIRLVPDEDNPFLALDEAGNKFDYARGVPDVPEGQITARAIDWLGVKEPDYFD